MTLLTQKEIDHHLEPLSAWELVGHEITRTFTRKNFVEAIEFVDTVAELAEEADHHPDILIHGWNNVTITLSTHSEGGLTEKDFELASKIEAKARETEDVESKR